MNNVSKLRFWCQKVLPLVYDDSLSYYELLCKVVKYLNDVVENIKDIPEYIDEQVNERLSDEHLAELIDAVFAIIKKSVTANDENDNTNASKNYSRNELLWHSNILYVATKDIPHGNLFIFEGDDLNVAPITFEERTEVVYSESASKLTIHGKVE